MADKNQLTIKFGGDGNIKVDTLTEFLDNYKQLLYLINNELGYNPDDMIIEVSPPENGSFKIKLKSKYKDLILEKMGDLTVGTVVGLLILFATNATQNKTEEEIKQILKDKQIVDKELPKIIYNVSQNSGANQKIQQTFIIVNNDENVKDLKIEREEKEIININRTDFPKLIDQSEAFEIEETPESDTLTDEATLIIKTIHFEGHAKWAFIFRGYPIKASIKDDDFFERLKTEAFRKGDALKVILSRKRNFDEDLQTYIVDQNSYVIDKVTEHISKTDNQNRLKFE
jgi:3-methyladenine DNA glycosylase Tag